MSRFFGQVCAFEIYVAALVVAVSVVLPTLLLPALVILMVFWPLRRLAAGYWTERTPADPGITILAVLALLGLWTSALPMKSLPQILRLLVGIGFYFALVNGIKTERQIRFTALVVVLAAASLAVFAAISVDWTQSKLPFLPAVLYDRFFLLVADTVHPNVLGGNLVLLLTPTAALLFWGWERLRPAWYSIIFALFTTMLVVLVLSQSRGALMALAAALLVLIALRWRWGWVPGVLASGAIVAFFSLAGSKDLLDSLLGGAALDGFDGRVEIWLRAVYMIQDFPFTGVGMGLYGDAADLLYPFFTAEPGSVYHAHNLFLQVGVDLGIPGLVAWLSVYLLIFAGGWRLYRLGSTDGRAWVAGFGAGILALQVALSVHGLFDAVTWGMVRPAPLVWGLWGLATAAWVRLDGRSIPA